MKECDVRTVTITNSRKRGRKEIVSKKPFEESFEAPQVIFIKR